MLRAYLLCLLLAAISLSSGAQVSVKGYYRADGTYVSPHIRSAPDGTKSNNYGASSSSPYYTGKGSVTPPYSRDVDRDGTANLLDWDDDNDGRGDDFDLTSRSSQTGFPSIPMPVSPQTPMSWPLNEATDKKAEPAAKSLATSSATVPCVNGHSGCVEGIFTPNQKGIFDQAAMSRNFQLCRNRLYGCDDTLLTEQQKVVSYQEMLSRNFHKCRNGFYGCDDTLLTEQQKVVSYQEMLSRNFHKCRNGFYGCDETLLQQ
ncbi:MAG: hypothetical protein FP825_09725 [Hyphomonas sp.]|uniref:hypothetical protein n=1 Tax=Hyphomonas sp. TaxID=87 RepID=UPI0017E7DB34|nr:hypothetical protein [Hyphomonas sp.]MBA3068747.1 hypothetical protein [Hyphomonas sp.]MBU4063589.1 hypothetical protein [Alphaproteobacteria bacterium]MBU4165786.1 hypothetical protein [Alphaproteobacteria bacterium]